MAKETKKPGFAFGKENYRILIIGVLGGSIRLSANDWRRSCKS